jgi:hypothetical protein
MIPDGAVPIPAAYGENPGGAAGGGVTSEDGAERPSGR